MVFLISKTAQKLYEPEKLPYSKSTVFKKFTGNLLCFCAKHGCSFQTSKIQPIICFVLIDRCVELPTIPLSPVISLNIRPFDDEQ